MPSQLVYNLSGLHCPHRIFNQTGNVHLLTDQMNGNGPYICVQEKENVRQCWAVWSYVFWSYVVSQCSRPMVLEYEVLCDFLSHIFSFFHSSPCFYEYISIVINELKLYIMKTSRKLCAIEHKSWCLSINLNFNLIGTLHFCLIPISDYYIT